MSSPNYDVWEDASYADEDRGASDSCDFDDEGVVEMDMLKYSFDSVKKIGGSGRSIAYILNMIVPVRGRDVNSGRLKWCDYLRTLVGPSKDSWSTVRW